MLYRYMEQQVDDTMHGTDVVDIPLGSIDIKTVRPDHGGVYATWLETVCQDCGKPSRGKHQCLECFKKNNGGE